MKAVACLLLFSLAGLVSTQYSFQPGRRYVYGVTSRLMTGISEINTQYAGLELHYRIALQVVNPTTIVIKPEHISAYEVNAEQPDGWRETVLENKTPVEMQPEMMAYLESPMELTMKDGYVEAIKVEENLPTWAVNLKKALASKWSLDTTGAQAVLAGNLNRKTNSVRPEEENTDSGFFYEVMENTVLGECETYYTVSQQGPFQPPYPYQRDTLPAEEDSNEVSQNDQQNQPESSEENHNNEQYKYKYGEFANYEEQQAYEQKYADAYQKKYYYSPAQDQQNQAYKYYMPEAYNQYFNYKQYAQSPDSGSAEDSRETREGELPWPKAFDSFCNKNDHIFEITKSVNFTACKNKPVLSYSTSNGFYARGGDNNYGTAFDRAVISRYLACGKDRKQYTILQVKVEEQVNAGLRLKQKTVAGSIQNMTLLAIQKAQSPIKIQRPKVINDLSYTFDPQEQRLQKAGYVNHAYQGGEDENDSSEEATTSRYYANNYNYNSNYNYDAASGENYQAAYPHYYKSDSKSRLPRAVNNDESSEESEDTKAKDAYYFRYETAAEGKGQLPKPSMKYAPINPHLASPLQTSGMKKRIVALMKEIIEDITTNKQSMAEAETLSKISIVAKICRYLNYADVEELYHQIASKSQTEEDQTYRQVFLDALKIAGTNPCINFLCDLILKKELTGEAAAQIIASFPMYIRTPTEQLIKRMHELADSSAIEAETQVKTSAILAFSNILYQACVNTEIAESRYPQALYGQFCDAKLVQRQYVQWFIRNLKKYMESNQQQDKHFAITYLVALGNLGVPEVVPVVQRILDEEEDAYFKVQAIFALKHLCVSRSATNIPVNAMHGIDRDTQDLITDEVVEKEVLPILVAVQNDKSEHPEVRMAAVSLLIYTTNADLTIWQQLAYSTWQPYSREVHAYIYSTLKYLAELERPLGFHRRMSYKARAVLPLCKPMAQGFAKSKNMFSSHWLQHIQTRVFQHFSYFGSKDSIFPSYLHYQNTVDFGNVVSDHPIEVSIRGQTLQRLANFFADEIMKKTSADEAHQELEAIHNILGISQREMDEKPEAHLRIKLRDEMERLWSLNEETIQELLGKAKGEWFPKLQNGIQINYQKTHHLYEHTDEFPSIMGLPLMFHHRIPAHFSLRGSVKLVNENGFKDIQLQADLHPVYASKSHYKLVYKVPFTGHAYAAGVMQHTVIELPHRMVARWAPRGQVVFAISPAPLVAGTPAGEIDFLTYHQRPYTAIITDSCWPVNHREGGKMEIVHDTSDDEPYKNMEEFEYLQKNAGLAIKMEEVSEYRDQSETASGWVRFFKRFHTAGCWFNVGFLGGETIRFSERKWTIDVSKSETKTLGFAVGYNSRYNPTNEDLWNDSVSGSSQSSEEQQGDQAYVSNNFYSSEESSSERRQPTRGERRNGVHPTDYYPTNTGRTVAVAFIGKRAAIKSVQESHGQIQKILSKDYPSTIQYLVQVSRSNGRFYLRAAAGEAANEAAKQLPQTHSSLVAIREMVYEAQNQKSQPDYCTEFEGEFDYPKHANPSQLIVLRKMLLEKDLFVKVKGEVQFGPSCSRMPHSIKLTGKLQRGPKMTEWAKKDSRQAQKCAEDEKKGFSVSPVCLYVAEHQAAALNHADLKITFTPNLPIEFRNRTMDFEDFLKAVFYVHLSNDQFHEGAGPGQINIDARMTPNNNYYDVHITKPNSRISFRSVRTNGFTKAVFPLTATQTLFNNVQDRLFRADSEPACSFQGNTVNTFDNVTYRFNEHVSSDCYQVLAKDCSGREPVAVLAKDITAEKTDLVLLLGGQTKIELNHPSTQQRPSKLFGRGKFEVEINDQKVDSLPHRVISKDGEEIARIEEMHEGGIQVYAQQFQLATNGKWIHIQASNSLRNRTCGLCGDFDGERIGEFRGPKDCALSSGSLLVAAYSYQHPEVKDKMCKVSQQAKAQIQHEQQNCLRTSYYQPNQQPMYYKAGNDQKFNYYPNENYYASSQEEQQPRYYASQQASGAPADGQCVRKFGPSIRKVVYDVCEILMTPFEWQTKQRQNMCHTMADNLRNEAKDMLSTVQNVMELIEKIHQKVCEEAKKFKSIGISSDAVCKGSKGFYYAYRYEFNAIAEESKCLAPSKSNYNPAQAQEQLKYAFYNEAKEDQSPYPFIANSKLPMTCPEKLERITKSIVSKYAYFLLLSDMQMSPEQKLRIKNEVQKAVEQAFRQKQLLNQTDRLIETIVKNVQEAMPVFYRKWMSSLVRATMHLSIFKLCSFDKCCFPLPTQSGQQAYPQGYQYSYNQYANQYGNNYANQYQ